jgi:hypothetical protein
MRIWSGVEEGELVVGEDVNAFHHPGIVTRNLTNKTAWVNMNGYVSPPFDAAPIVATALSGRLVTVGVDRRF